MKKIVIRGILSFPHLFEADNSDMGGGKYAATVLIPKSDTKQIEMIEDAIEDAKEAGKTEKWGGKIPNNLRLPLHDGDDVDYDGYAGHYYLKLTTKTRPSVVGRDMLNIVDPEEVYAGCQVYVSAVIAAYNAGGSKGVSGFLNNVMKYKDGERLGGGKSSAQDDFGDLDLGDDDDDFLD